MLLYSSLPSFFTKTSCIRIVYEFTKSGDETLLITFQSAAKQSSCPALTETQIERLKVRKSLTWCNGPASKPWQLWPFFTATSPLSMGFFFLHRLADNNTPSEFSGRYKQQMKRTSISQLVYRKATKEDVVSTSTIIGNPDNIQEFASDKSSLNTKNNLSTARTQLHK